MSKNFKDDIIATLDSDEKIEAVVIGEYGWGGYGSEDRQLPEQKQNIILSLEEASNMLDYTYDTGYGAPQCNAVYVWTTENILIVSQYDGSTSIHKIPRNPVECKPKMPGG